MEIKKKKEEKEELLLQIFKWLPEVLYLVTQPLRNLLFSHMKWCSTSTGFIFEHLTRNPRFDNVTRRPGYSRGPSGFLPVAIEGMSFFKGLFSKEKGTFGFLGAISPSKSPKSQKDLFSRKRTVKMTFPPTLEKSVRSREYLGSSVTLSRRGAKS